MTDGNSGERPSRGSRHDLRLDTLGLGARQIRSGRVERVEMRCELFHRAEDSALMASVGASCFVRIRAASSVAVMRQI